MQNEKIFKKKRIGWGYTLNLRTKGGWFVLLGMLIVVAAFLFFTFWSIPNEMDFEINGTQATILSPSFTVRSFTFDTSDIISIYMREDMPSTSRRFGLGSRRLLAGRFDIEGYDRGHVYIHRNAPPFIAIQLPDGWVFVNGGSREATEGIFAQLVGE